MSEIKINKPTNLDPIRRVQTDEVQKAERGNAESIEKKIVSSQDKLDVSSRAAEVGELVEEVKNLPDVREAKVQEVREQIESGDFNPSNEKIAEAILEEEG